MPNTITPTKNAATSTAAELIMPIIRAFKYLWSKLLLRILVIIIIALGIFKYVQISRAITQSKMFAPPPTTVTTLVTAETIWPRSIHAVGSFVASQGITLSAEVEGRVKSVLFESGQEVQAGAVLIELDSSVEEAQLAGAIALRDDTSRSLKRAQSLRTSNVIPQSDFDSASAKAKEAEAAVSALQASIAKKKITAPFTGRSGIRLVNVGQYLASGTPVVPIYSMNPLFVNFALPQQSISDLQVGLKVKITVDTFPTEVFEGTLTSINPQVDSLTRNIGLQATIPNVDGKLRPGMFGDINVVLAGEEKVIAIPISSINYAPYSDTVYVIEKNKAPDNSDVLTVRQQVVKLGSKRGDQVAVLQGLKSGDEVVSAGTFRLRPNAPVVINNSVTPGNNPAPQPSDT